MSNRELFKYDVRVRERFVADGEITKSDVERYLTALVDVADRCEEVDLEQPALAKEADNSREPEASVSFATSEALAPAFRADAPAERGPIPAIAESGPAPALREPALIRPAEAVPVVSQESSPPTVPASSEHHGPASVPPPTASVDADWGDS